MIETTTTPTPVKPVSSGLLGKFQSLGVFAKDHLMMLLFGVAMFVAFFFLPSFKEMAYGLLRAAVAVFFVAVIVYIWFKDTIRPYLVSGNFIEDFKQLEGKHRVAVTVTILLAVLWLITECLVHP